jgi:hypothetical protein
LNENKRLFTDQQIEQANHVNILAYAKSRGYELKRISNQSYKLPGYGGLFINGDGSKWNWFSQSKGGGAIQFVMEMESKSWVDAVKELLGISHDEMPVVSKPKENETKGDMVLPDKNSSYKHLFAYLIKSRGIDQDVVTEFVDKKLIYEDRRRNCVFVGYDKERKPAYASLRSTRTVGEVFRGDVKNSDKGVPFHFEGDSKAVCVFESPIDLMSYLSLIKIYDVEDFNHHLISLGGVSDKALMSFLDKHKDIETVILCLDNDEAGTNACLRIGIKLQDNYQLRRHSPKGKDFNEDLVAINLEVIGNRVREPPEDYDYGNEM